MGSDQTRSSAQVTDLASGGGGGGGGWVCHSCQQTYTPYFTGGKTDLK
jgi:hypothetical protein